MSVVDSAIARMQDLVQACTSVTVKLAPDYPISDASMLPLSIAHLVEGSGQADTADQTRLLLTANVDIHFSRQSLKDAYQKIDAVAVEYLQRLAGDPTLNGTIDTIVFPVTFSVTPAQWDNVQTQMITFVIPFKELTTPLP
jgi:hypothetical protein